MLVNTRDIIKSTPVLIQPEQGDNQPDVLVAGSGESVFIANQDLSLTKSIGILSQGKDTHYYSFGNFNLVRLIMYIINQTGPAHAFMTSYSFSHKSISQIQNRLDNKKLLSFKVIVDNRVKTMSPKPFQMLSGSFNYRCTSIHAKVALIWNDNWKVSIVTSQNATDNPKLERGTIFTNPAVFNFDLKTLENEFNRGSL